MRNLFFFLITLFSITHLTAQNNVIVDSMLWQPNGVVEKLKVMGDTLVIAGNFDFIAPNTPYATSFDNNGDLISDFPHTNGEVTKAIVDDKNGLYIAGDFTVIGGKKRGGLAYVDSNNQVTSFFEHQAVEGLVYDMQIKDSLLYIVGEFTGVNKYTGGGALIRTDTTLVDFSFPTIEGDVFTSEPDGEGGVYIGGKFTKVGNYIRLNIAHIDKYGRVTPWNPGTDGEVRAIAIDERHIYVGGDFKYAGCYRREKLAVFEKGNNTPNSWDYFEDFRYGNKISSLLHYGGKIFVGRNHGFSSGPGQANLIGINKSTGDIVFRSYNITGVNAIAAGNDKLYIGGDINDDQVAKLIQVDTTYGSEKFGKLIFREIKGSINVLKYHKDILYVAGTSGTNNTYQNIFTIDVNTHLKHQQNFIDNDRGPIYGLEIFNDSILVAVGNIKAYDDNQQNIRAFNINSLEKVSFPYQTSERIHTITKLNNNTFFIGGYFKTVTTGITNSIAEINIKTSKQTNWRFSFNFGLKDIEIVDTNVYVAGGILAKLNTKSNNYTPWGPSNIYAVKSLAIKGDTLYVGGGFPKLDTFNFGYLGALNRFTGKVYPWDAKVVSGINNGVWGLKIYNSKLFVNGGFIKIDTFTRRSIASFDANTGALLPFKADINQQNVGSIETFDIWDDKLVCGGNVINYFDQPRRYISIYDINTGAPINSNINTFLSVSTIVSTNNKLFLGGKFRMSGGVIRKGIALIDLKTGKPYPWKADINQRVFEFDIADGKIYYSGFFTEVNGQKRNFAAASYLSNGNLHSWDPSPDRFFSKLNISNGKVYVGGPFIKIKDSVRKYFTALDTITGIPSSLQPLKNSKTGYLTNAMHSYKNTLYVSNYFRETDTLFINKDTVIRPYFFALNTKADTLVPFGGRFESKNFSGVINIFDNNNSIYLGGYVDKIDSINVHGFIKADPSSGNIDTTWFPNSNDRAIPLGINANELYFSLNHSFLNNKRRYYLSSINSTTKKITPWHPQINISPTTIGFSNNKVFMGGEFTQFNNKERDFLVGASTNALSIDIENKKNYCLGETIVVKTNTSGVFNSGNKFILLMSDTMGSFSNPIFSDTINSSLDSFLYQIPTSLPPNSNYRLKVVSTSPHLTHREELNINIVEKPNVSFTVNDTSLCINDTFTFTNSSVNNNSLNTTYNWYFGDSAVASSANSTHHYQTSGKYQVFLKASRGNCSDSTKQEVIVFDNPKTKFQVNDSQQCLNTQLFSFTDSSQSQIGDSINIYNWNFGDANQSSLQNPTHSYSNDGKYEVELKTTTINGCSDTSTFNITVFPTPKIDTILGPTIVKMQDTSTYVITTDTFTTYFWSVNYGTINLGTDSSFANIKWDSVPTYTNTTIKIFPINDAGCFGDTAYLDIQISPFPIGIINIKNEQLKIYPNPAKKSIFIELNSNDITSGKVQLFDIVGKEVLTKTYSNISAADLEIDISKLEAGTYLIQFSNSNYKASAKVIVIID